MEGDADAAEMTLEQLKRNLYQKFQQEGMVDQIRVQLRTSFVQKLKSTPIVPVNSVQNEWTILEKVANSMISQYLHLKDLRNTLSVFLPEVGTKNCDLQDDMMRKLLKFQATTPENEQLWLMHMLQSVETRASIGTHDIQTQTMEEDRRFVLDSELKRIENNYWSQSTLQKETPLRTLEERMILFQQEYDSRSQTQMKKELDRIREVEVSMMRVEERKRYAKETDALRLELQSEYTAKVQALKEQESSIHVEYLDHKKAKADLFELRQTLLKDIEQVRAKERQLISFGELETMKHGNEQRRLALVEDNLRTRERQLDQTLQQVERDRAELLERITKESEAQLYQQRLELKTLQNQLEKEQHALRENHEEYLTMTKRLAQADAQLLTARGVHAELKLKLEQLDQEKCMYQTQLQSQQNQNLQLKSELETANAALTASESTLVRLEREASAKKVIHERILQEKKSFIEELQTEIHKTRHENIQIKLQDADGILAMKKSAYEAVEAERDYAKRQEENYRLQIYTWQTKCNELEALTSRYRTQYEDEQIHVASLRHEIASLNGLINTYKYASDGNDRRQGNDRFPSRRSRYDGETELASGVRNEEQYITPRRLVRMYESANTLQEVPIQLEEKPSDSQQRAREAQKKLDEERYEAEEQRIRDTKLKEYEKALEEAEMKSKKEIENQCAMEAKGKAELDAKLKQAQDDFERQLELQAKQKDDMLRRLQEAAALEEKQRQNAEAERLRLEAIRAADMERLRQDQAKEKEEMNRRLQEAATQEEKLRREAETERLRLEKLLEDQLAAEKRAREIAELEELQAKEKLAKELQAAKEELRIQAEQEAIEARKRDETAKTKVKEPPPSTQVEVEVEAEVEVIDDDECNGFDESFSNAEDQKDLTNNTTDDKVLFTSEVAHSHEIDVVQNTFIDPKEVQATNHVLEGDDEDRLKVEAMERDARAQEVIATRQRLENEKNEAKRIENERQEAEEVQRQEEERLRLQELERENEKKAIEAATRIAEDEQRAKEEKIHAENEEERMKHEEDARIAAEQELQKQQEEEKKKQDSNIIDEYRQRALARRAEKQRLEKEAQEKAEEDERRHQAELERQRQEAEEETKSESAESIVSVGGIGDESDNSADSF